MKTLRDCLYDGPQDVRSMLRASNGVSTYLSVVIGDSVDYWYGKILTHPTHLIIQGTNGANVSIPIEDVPFYRIGEPILAVVNEYIWRFKDGKRLKVYRRDGEGDHLIQQRTH